jgi:hypothetical protein
MPFMQDPRHSGVGFGVAKGARSQTLGLATRSFARTRGMSMRERCTDIFRDLGLVRRLCHFDQVLESGVNWISQHYDALCLIASP